MHIIYWSRVQSCRIYLCIDMYFWYDPVLLLVTQVFHFVLGKCFIVRRKISMKCTNWCPVISAFFMGSLLHRFILLGCWLLHFSSFTILNSNFTMGCCSHSCIPFYIGLFFSTQLNLISLDESKPDYTVVSFSSTQLNTFTR